MNMSTTIKTKLTTTTETKPWYRRTKLWAAVVTGVANIGAVSATIYVGHPELAAVLAASITGIGAALVIAIGQADKGKEAAFIEAAAKRAEGVQ
jgi:hypothetical protein